MYKLLERFYEGRPTILKVTILIVVGACLNSFINFAIPYMDLNFMGGLLGRFFQFLWDIAKFLGTSALMGTGIFFILFWYYITERVRKAPKARDYNEPSL